MNLFSSSNESSDCLIVKSRTYEEQRVLTVGCPLLEQHQKTFNLLKVN
jgi:hypothetical protein